MTITIPVPQRTNNRIVEEFYPLQREELIKLYEVGLIKSAAYVHFALRLENPYCDRPVQIIPKEFALRWRIPEKSVYRAIARLKELGILNIKSGKLVVEWNRPEMEELEEEEEAESAAVNENHTQFSEVRKEINDSQSCEKILRSEKKFSEVRKNSQSCENQGLKPLVDIASSIPQTLQNIQTNQTKRGKEKTFSQSQESNSPEVVQSLVQNTNDESKSTTDKSYESVGQTTAKVVHEKTKIISPSKSSSTSIPDDLRERLEELEIKLDAQVRKAIANHDISQAYGAAAHVENTRESIINTRAVFLHQLPQQPIEKLGSRYSEELLNNVKAQNKAIEQERSDPEYFEKSKDAFAQIRATLRKKAN